MSSPDRWPYDHRVAKDDYLDVIEAAYQLDAGPTPRAWIQAVTEAAGRVLGGRFGVLGMIYDASNPARMKANELVTTGDPRLGEIARGIVEVNVDQAYVERTYRALPCAL